MKRWVLSILFLITVAFSCLPGFHPESIAGLPYRLESDMFFHGSFYFALSLAVYRLMMGSKRGWLAFHAIFAGSVLLEMVQIAIPDRTVSGTDLAANFLGVYLAMAICYLVSYRKRRANNAVVK